MTYTSKKFETLYGRNPKKIKNSKRYIRENMCECKQGKKENEFKTQKAVMRVST